MITIINNSDTYEYRGLSTDTKPTNCPNGSLWLEMNTGKIFFFDIESETWIEWGA